jgi:hypothetical protein
MQQVGSKQGRRCMGTKVGGGTPPTGPTVTVVLPVAVAKDLLYSLNLALGGGGGKKKKKGK